MKDDAHAEFVGRAFEADCDGHVEYVMRCSLYDILNHKSRCSTVIVKVGLSNSSVQHVIAAGKRKSGEWSESCNVRAKQSNLAEPSSRILGRSP